MENFIETKRIPTCWILSDGTIGMELQSIALAEALDLNYEKKIIKPYWLNRILPTLANFPGIPLAAEAGEILSLPTPNILITCGRRHAGASIALKRRSKNLTYTIHIQDPRINSKHFDLLIIPEHDPSRGSNIITSKGSLNRITPSLLENEARLFIKETQTLKGKKVAVNIGGNTKNHTIDHIMIKKLVVSLNQFSIDNNCSLMITTSKRSNRLLQQELCSLTRNPNIIVWTSGEPNPYLGFLGIADLVIVTSDSINMISEACSTGKPVYIFPFGKDSKRRNKFIQSMETAGIARYFNGKSENWDYEPLNETTRIAIIIKNRLKAENII